MNQNCLVSEVTVYGLGNRDSIPGRDALSSRPALESTQTPVGTGGSFPTVKQPQREVYHSSPSITEVKNTWMFTSIPHTSPCLSA